MRRVFLLLAAFALAACGSEGTETADSGGADTSTSDVGVPDTSTADSGGADTSTSDVDAPDTGTSDVLDEETTEPCDADAIAYEALAPIDAVARNVVTAEADGEGWTLTIDASAGGTIGAPNNPYVYVDLLSGTGVEISDVEALTDPTWTVAFKRASIRTNSGNSGPGSYMVARVDGFDFESAPTPGRDATWHQDDFVDASCEILTEGRGTPRTAFGIWYDYDESTHVVSPPDDVVFFVYDPTTHVVLKLAITGWDSGVFTLRVVPV